MVSIALITSLALAQGIGQAQINGLWTPNASPGASVGQTIALTNVEIVYHRPSVNERDVWGALVPFDQVWRAGANENTAFLVSTDVTVQGEPLAAGTYGLHAIPGDEGWTLIFSHDRHAWGSFAYDESRDALRVTATPVAAEHTEQLQYSFTDATDQSATAHLRWAELDVPFTIAVDRDATVLASFRDQLTGLGQFDWVAPFQAAQWCLAQEVNLEEALGWVDQSIQAEARYDNHFVRSQILEALGRGGEAATAKREALARANAGNLHQYARTLQAEGDFEGAMRVFRRNARQNPDAWFVDVGMARGYSGLGRFGPAARHMRVALGRAPENQKAYIQSLVDTLQRSEAI